MGIYNGVIKKPVISPVFTITFQQNSLKMFKRVNSIIIKISIPRNHLYKKISLKNLFSLFFKFRGSLPGEKSPKIKISTCRADFFYLNVEMTHLSHIYIEILSNPTKETKTEVAQIGYQRVPNLGHP
jgi:hypothetical protein